jgi:hypothetical protein
MDSEILIWAAIFIGGYSVILGYFLRIALRRKDE